MMNRPTISALLLVAAMAFTAPVNAFLVSDFDGKRVETNDYIGDGLWTLVMFWQLNCVPCEEQKPVVEAFHKKHKTKSAHVVGLVLDGHEYMPQIKEFVAKKPTAFPSHVVFGDVFHDQIMEETGGKAFPAAPGYLVYSPEGKLELIINSPININELISYLENQFGS